MDVDDNAPLVHNVEFVDFDAADGELEQSLQTSQPDAGCLSVSGAQAICYGDVFEWAMSVATGQLALKSLSRTRERYTNISSELTVGAQVARRPCLPGVAAEGENCSSVAKRAEEAANAECDKFR